MIRTKLNFVLLSGGIDSCTVLTCLLKDLDQSGLDSEVIAIGLKYPSKHNVLERIAGQAIAEYHKIPYHTIDATTVFEEVDSSLLNKHQKIPEGHYTDSSMKSTVIPLRNIIFTSIVAGRIMSVHPDEMFTLLLGIHAGDHPIYPDCRPTTLIAMRQTLWHATDSLVCLEAPFINNTKEYIVAVGLGYGAPYHLTRTCYTGDEIACGRCGSCVERLEAFKKNDASDPLPYQNKS